MTGITQGRRFRSTSPFTFKPQVTRQRTPAQQLQADTRRVNRALHAFGNYHDFIPLDAVNIELADAGFDELPDMLLCGAQGSINESVGRNRWLSLTWYKMESGRYEVVAYVS